MFPYRLILPDEFEETTVFLKSSFTIGEGGFTELVRQASDEVLKVMWKKIKGEENIPSSAWDTKYLSLSKIVSNLGESFNKEKYLEELLTLLDKKGFQRAEFRCTVEL